jgi:hypothetical protein
VPTALLPSVIVIVRACVVAWLHNSFQFKSVARSVAEPASAAKIIEKRSVLVIVFVTFFATLFFLVTPE